MLQCQISGHVHKHACFWKQIPTIAFFGQSDHVMYSLVKYILLMKIKFWDLQL